jgi:hypothetical protein
LVKYSVHKERKGLFHLEWKEKLKSYGVPGTILAGIIGLFIFYLNTNDADILEEFHKLMSKMFALDFLIYKEKSNSLNKALQFMALLFINGLFLLGIVNIFAIIFNLFRKKPTLLSNSINNHDSYIELEDKLGDALIAFDDQSPQRVIGEKVTIFMNTKQMEIKRIFGVSEREIDFVWYFEGRDNNIDLVYFKDPADIEGVGKLIDSSLYMPDVRVNEPFVNSQIGLQDSKIKQFISVRNYGNLKLGLAVFILKKDVFTEQNLQEFTYYTSKMILLGTHSQFLRQVKKKKQIAN